MSTGLSFHQTTEVKEMIRQAVESHKLNSSHKSYDSEVWSNLAILAEASRAQAKEIADLKLRLTRVEPHDHTYKCTTCGHTHDNIRDAGAPSY